MLRCFLALLLLLVCPFAACRLAPPTPEAWLQVGFRSPRQTFETFQTALRADWPDLEYRCLAQEMKAREGLNQLAYRTFRQELFAENPWLKYAACARIVDESHPAPDRRLLVARVSKLFVERDFTVELVREDFYELYADGELLEDGFADFERSLSTPGGSELRIHLPLPVGSEPARLSEGRLGREWKITGFYEAPPAADETTPAPAP